MSEHKSFQLTTPTSALAIAGAFIGLCAASFVAASFVGTSFETKVPAPQTSAPLTFITAKPKEDIFTRIKGVPGFGYLNHDSPIGEKFTASVNKHSHEFEKIDKEKTFVKALLIAKPFFANSSDEMDDEYNPDKWIGKLMISFWIHAHYTLEQMKEAFNTLEQTTYSKAMKSIDTERGKVICVKGSTQPGGGAGGYVEQILLSGKAQWKPLNDSNSNNWRISNSKTVMMINSITLNQIKDLEKINYGTYCGIVTGIYTNSLYDGTRLDIDSVGYFITQ
jgi:hypothetical protein